MNLNQFYSEPAELRTNYSTLPFLIPYLVLFLSMILSLSLCLASRCFEYSLWVCEEDMFPISFTIFGSTVSNPVEVIMIQYVFFWGVVFWGRFGPLADFLDITWPILHLYRRVKPDPLRLFRPAMAGSADRHPLGRRRWGKHYGSTARRAKKGTASTSLCASHLIFEPY